MKNHNKDDCKPGGEGLIVPPISVRFPNGKVTSKPASIMKTKHLLCSLVAFSLSQITGQAATIVTSGDISAAATNPDTNDLGDTSISIGDFTITSTGGNLGYGAFGAPNFPEYIGVVGLTSGRTVEAAEQLTLSFTGGTVSLNSLSLGDHGANDFNAIISGFSIDPGASVTGLPTGWTVSYASNAVTIASNSNAGYRETYTVNFANTVNVTALGITAPNVAGGAGGVGFVAVNFVPEPSAALLGGLGMLCLFRRRR